MLFDSSANEKKKQVLLMNQNLTTKIVHAQEIISYGHIRPSWSIKKCPSLEWDEYIPFAKGCRRL